MTQKDEQPDNDTQDTWELTPEEDDFLIQSIGVPGFMYRQRKEELEAEQAAREAAEREKSSPKANEDSSTSPPTDQP